MINQVKLFYNAWYDVRYAVLQTQVSSSVMSNRLCNPMICSMPVLPVHHQLPEFTETHVHWVGDAIQPSNLSSPSPAFNLSQHQGLFQWVRSSYQVAKVLELQLQLQSFQWIFRFISFRIDWFDLGLTGKIEVRRERGWQRMRWLDEIGRASCRERV